MRTIESFVTTCMSLASANTMVVLGVTSGEISEAQALRVYGKWFREHLRKGDIAPAWVGDRKRYYKVTDILALKAKDCAPCEINWNNIKTIQQ